MDKNLLEVIECLIDEIMYSKHPSDTTLDVLSKHSDLQLVKDYFEWRVK